MDKLSTYAPLIARIFIGLFFLLAGVGKVFDIAGTAGYMSSVGLPGFLAWPATLFEIALGLSLLLGFKIRLAALAGAPREGDLLALTPIFASAALVLAVGVGAATLLDRRRATLRR